MRFGRTTVGLGCKLQANICKLLKLFQGFPEALDGHPYHGDSEGGRLILGEPHMDLASAEAAKCFKPSDAGVFSLLLLVFFNTNITIMTIMSIIAIISIITIITTIVIVAITINVII